MSPYDIIKKLGCGAYADVYLCRKKHNLQEIVIKQIRGDKIQNSETVMNEVRILKSLNHSNVITYYDSYWKNDIYFIIMEYAIHGTLYDIIQRSKGTFFSKETAINMFIQILLGLKHIHEKNIIHRDLKPENIFITGYRKDVIKIGDFGVSKLLGSKGDETKTGIGTINYLAPEICNGKPYDIKSDMWSLGCVVYELCSLERLFDGSLMNIMHCINSGLIKCIDTYRYGNNLQNVFNMLMHADPKFRPTTTSLLQMCWLNSYIVAAKLSIGIIY